MDSSQANALKSLQFLSATFMGIVFWEYIIWLPNEVCVWRKLAGRVSDPITKKRLHPTIGEALAIWLRYTVVACAISVGFLDFGRPSSCQAAVTLTWVFGCLCWAGISLLFTLRLYVIYNRSRAIVALFGFLWCAALALWLAVAATWRASNKPQLVAPGAPWCVQSNSKPYRTANWGAEMVFDLCVLVATLFRLHQLQRAVPMSNGSSRRMRSFILRSNLGYFIVSFVLSLSAFVVQTTVKDLILSQVLTPPAISLTPVVAIRIVFSATNDAAIEDIMPARGDDNGDDVESRRSSSRLGGGGGAPPTPSSVHNDLGLASRGSSSQHSSRTLMSAYEKPPVTMLRAHPPPPRGAVPAASPHHADTPPEGWPHRFATPEGWRKN